MSSIDLSMTWGEWGNCYRRFAETGEVKAVRQLRPDLARALASAEALKQIQTTLSDDQKVKVASVMTQELTKQGF